MGDASEEWWEQVRSAEQEIAAARQEGDAARVVHSLLVKARGLRRAGESADAVAAVDELLGILGDDPTLAEELAVQELRARTVRAIALRHLNRSQAAWDELDHVATVSCEDGRPEVQEIALGAESLRLVWLSQDRRDDELIVAARALLAETEEAAGRRAGRARATALGLMADAQARIRDWPAAVLTRIRLVEEHADTQINGNPLFLPDQRRKLASELYGLQRFAEAAAVSQRLAEDLEGLDVVNQETRIADALRVQALALAVAGPLAAHHGLVEEIQRRYAGSTEPGARAAAASALTALSRSLLRAGDVVGVGEVCAELLVRLQTEPDPATVTFIGIELETVARQLVQGRFSPRQTMLIYALSSAARTLDAIERRPRGRASRRLMRVALRNARWRSTARWVRRCDEALLICDRLEDRFGADSSPKNHALLMTVPLRRATVLMRAGRFIAASRQLLQFSELGGPALSAVIDGQKPYAKGHYRDVVWIAALMGSSTPKMHTVNQTTRAQMQTILSQQRFPRAVRTAVNRQLHSL